MLARRLILLYLTKKNFLSSFFYSIFLFTSSSSNSSTAILISSTQLLLYPQSTDLRQHARSPQDGGQPEGPSCEVSRPEHYCESGDHQSRRCICEADDTRSHIESGRRILGSPCSIHLQCLESLMSFRNKHSGNQAKYTMFKTKILPLTYDPDYPQQFLEQVKHLTVCRKGPKVTVQRRQLRRRCWTISERCHCLIIREVSTAAHTASQPKGQRSAPMPLPR